MNKTEKEIFERLKKDFEQLKKERRFGKFQQEKLFYDLTGLIGWYNIDPDKRLRHLIEQMITFGQSKKWPMAGPRVTFEHFKKKHRSK